LSSLLSSYDSVHFQSVAETIFFLGLSDTEVMVVDSGRAKFLELPADAVGVFELEPALDAWLMGDLTWESIGDS